MKATWLSPTGGEEAWLRPSLAPWGKRGHGPDSTQPHGLERGHSQASWKKGIMDQPQHNPAGARGCRLAPTRCAGIWVWEIGSGEGNIFNGHCSPTTKFPALWGDPGSRCNSSMCRIWPTGRRLSTPAQCNKRQLTSNIAYDC